MTELQGNILIVMVGLCLVLVLLIVIGNVTKHGISGILRSIDGLAVGTVFIVLFALAYLFIGFN